MQETTQLFDMCSKPFKTIETEYKFMNELKNMGVYEDSLPYTIQTSIVTIISQNGSGYDKKEFVGYVMPLSFQFKNFFLNEQYL